ncbi:NAD(P)-dependent oxidoreductase [bacterium]|nr:NAD(P)-dependent oxidoreductase [bacterium]
MNVFLTGATGVMGMETLIHLMQHNRARGDIKVTVLARDSKVNRRKLRPFIEKGVEVIWGDLMNPSDVGRGVAQADIVLHVGGMVSPMADWKPELTYRVNTGSMRNIIDAALSRQRSGRQIKVVYIGSVSQYGNRPEGVHWGRCGDPINVATFDMYALSKCEAERMLAESGLEWWVSLRQTGIMYDDILFKGSDPISFHVPVRGCLEWISSEESGGLAASLCVLDLPDNFWRGFYNIGGGEKWRLTNYDFLNMTLSAVGCPPASESFRRNWFATRNFHGMWFTDSDALESLLHFRSGLSMVTYMELVQEDLPWYFKLAPLAPAWIIRMVMKLVASRKILGPLNWLAENNEDRIQAAWGGREEYARIPSWEDDAAWRLSRTPTHLSHGYDESKPVDSWTVEDLISAAAFRGGKLIGPVHSDSSVATGSPDGKQTSVNPDVAVEWECAEGHRFRLTPRTVLKGGHWCPDCLREISNDPLAMQRQATRNPFLAQLLP